MATYLGNGTQLKLSSDTTTSSYVNIGVIESISGYEPQRDMLESSTLDSVDATSAYKEFIAGAFSAGQPTLSILFDPANTTHSLLVTAMRAGTLRPGKLHFNQIGTATTYDHTFTAIVAKVSPTIQVGQILKASVTLQITGPI